MGGRPSADQFVKADSLRARGEDERRRGRHVGGACCLGDTIMHARVAWLPRGVLLIGRRKRLPPLRIACVALFLVIGGRFGRPRRTLGSNCEDFKRHKEKKKVKK